MFAHPPKLYYPFLLWIFCMPVLQLYAAGTSDNESLINTTSLSGQVKTLDTGEPVPFANVFLANTLTGGITDENGYFELNNLPAGRFELVVSHIGYITYRQNIHLEGSKLTLQIVMTTDQQSLGEVVVTTRKDKKWQRCYR
jgi:hypothetical protein